MKQLTSVKDPLYFTLEPCLDPRYDDNGVNPSSVRPRDRKHESK